MRYYSVNTSYETMLIGLELISTQNKQLSEWTKKHVNYHTIFDVSSTDIVYIDCKSVLTKETCSIPVFFYGELSKDEEYIMIIHGISYREDELKGKDRNDLLIIDKKTKRIVVESVIPTFVNEFLFLRKFMEKYIEFVISKNFTVVIDTSTGTGLHIYNLIHDEYKIVKKICIKDEANSYDYMKSIFINLIKMIYNDFPCTEDDFDYMKFAPGLKTYLIGLYYIEKYDKKLTTNMVNKKVGKNLKILDYCGLLIQYFMYLDMLLSLNMKMMR